MRRRLVKRILAGALALAVVGGAAFYFLAVPGLLASRWEERALPAHERIGKALGPIRRTFTGRTFNDRSDTLDINSFPDEYLRKFARLTDRSRDRLEDAQAAVRRAQRELDAIEDEGALNAPNWPLLGGRGALEEPARVADADGDYLDSARTFLSEYDELIAWSLERLRFQMRVEAALSGPESETPGLADSPSEFTRPLGSAVRVVRTEVRDFREEDAPKGVRAEHRNVIATVTFRVARLRRYIRALRSLDADAIHNHEGRDSRGYERYRERTAGNYRRLLKSSPYTRRMKELGRREGKVSEAFRSLG